MLPSEQPVKSERGAKCSMYQTAWQVCKPAEGHSSLFESHSPASMLSWRAAGASEKQSASLQRPKQLTGATACVSTTMRQAQALQAIMQQAGEHHRPFPAWTLTFTCTVIASAHRDDMKSVCSQYLLSLTTHGISV